MSGTLNGKELIDIGIDDEAENDLIDMNPPVSVYATYRRLNYQPWYAIAEFVDNSTQNYFEHRDELKEAFKRNGEDCLDIRILYDNDKKSLIISDNANGMNKKELKRATQLNRPPPDTSGRSEFGMGLKTAACWFGRNWSIETKRLGYSKKYTVNVSIQDCIDNKEIIEIDKKPADTSEHFTVIKIMDLYKPLRGRTHQRIKDQLSSMYRQDLRTREINISYNGVPLKFEEQPILIEVLKDGTKRKWQKDISFEVHYEIGNKNLNVYGWVGLRSKGSQRDAGFVLFRRGRVILGGPDSGYKPLDIFGQGNTFQRQRLIGELHLDDWPVTQTKDMFDWSNGLEDEFVDKLKETIKEFIDKAENYRVPKELPSDEDMQEASKGTEKMVADKKFADAISDLLTNTEKKSEQRFEDAISNLLTNNPSSKIAEKTVEKENTVPFEEIKKISKGPLVFTLKLNDRDWNFELFWQNERSDAQWMSVDYSKESKIKIYLNSAHPFFIPYLNDQDILELLQKFVISIALSEKLARITASKGLIDPADFRDNMNIVLRHASELKEE